MVGSGSGKFGRSDTDSVSLTRDPKLLPAVMILQFFRSDPVSGGSDPDPVNIRSDPQLWLSVMIFSGDEVETLELKD